MRPYLTGIPEAGGNIVWLLGKVALLARGVLGWAVGWSEGQDWAPCLQTAFQNLQPAADSGSSIPKLHVYNKQGTNNTRRGKLHGA